MPKTQRKNHYSLAKLLGLAAIALVLGAIFLLRQPETMPRSKAPFAPLPMAETSNFSYFLSGYYAFSHGYLEEAAANFRIALQEFPQNDYLIRLAYEAELYTKGLDAALALIHEHHEAPEKLIGYLPFVAEALGHERYSKAIGLLEKMQNAGAESSKMRPHLDQAGNDMLLVPFIVGWCKAGQGKWGEAIALLKKIANPHASPLVNFHLALLYDISGDKKNATERMSKAIETYLYSYTSYTIAGNFFARNGDKEKARLIYQHYRGLYPFNDYFAAELAALDAAEQPIAPLIRQPKEGAGDLLAEMASGFLQNQLFQPAMIYAELASYLYPTHPQIQFVKGRIFELSGQADAAMVAYEAVPRENLFYVQAQTNMALLLFKQGDKLEAKQLLKKLGRAYASNQDIFIALADMHMQDNMFTEAVSTYNALLVKEKENEAYQWPIYFLRGVAHHRGDQWKLAESDLLKALALNPDQVDVLNYLGYSWLERKESMDKAAKLIRKAYQQRPTDIAIMDSMAWLLYHMRRFPEAERLLERIVSMQSDDPLIYEHLGDVYWQLKRPVQARFEWTHALSLTKKEEDTKRLEKKMEKGVTEEIPWMEPPLSLPESVKVD
jgi:tetratricopeptide (TPR) repeat protein